MREDRHVGAGCLRLDHHLDGQVLARKIAARLRLGIALATKLQRRCFLYGGLVGLARHLEVRRGLQVVMLDVL